MKWVDAILVFLLVRFILIPIAELIWRINTNQKTAQRILKNIERESSNPIQGLATSGEMPGEPKEEYQGYELTPLQKKQTEVIVENLLRKYPDALVGEVYPELVYKVLSEKLSSGEITKEKYESLIKDVVDKINLES